MPLAEAEIEDQVRAAKKEWQETVANTQSVESDAQLPAGVSRQDFTKWKEQQAVSARRRLSQLEERLQRLQLLRNKLAQMKASGVDTMQQTNANFGSRGGASMGQSVKWNLPGETVPEPPGPGPPAQLGTMRAAGDAQWSTLEDEDGDLDSPKRHDGGDGNGVSTFAPRQRANLRSGPDAPAHMAPPFTPGFSGLRQIIRDEMNTVVSQAVKEGLAQSKTVAWDENDFETEFVHAGQTEARSSPPQAGGRPGTRQAWTAQTNESEFPPDLDDDVDQDDKLKQVLMPNRIEDAEVRSLTLIFGGLSRQSPLRQKCFNMMRSSAWGTFFFSSTLLSCISSGLVVELGISQDPNYQIVEYCFNAVFLLEILVGVIALGLVQGPTSWLRVSGMNALDFVILLAIIMEQIMAQLGFVGITIVPFRIVRILKILAYFKAFSGIRNIVSTLMFGAVQMLTVFFVLLFVISAISTVFLTFLRGNLSRRCVVLDEHLGPCTGLPSSGFVASPSCNFKNWNTLPDLKVHAMDTPDTMFPVMVDDFYPFERWCKIQPNTSAGQYDDDPDFDLDFKGRYHTCGRNRPSYVRGTEMCAIVSSPSNGYSHYDDLGGSVVNLAQGAAADSYYDIMWRSFQSEPDATIVLILLYFLLTMMTTWLLLGIFVAVVTGTFKTIREKQKMEDAAEFERKENQDLEFYEGHGYLRSNMFESDEEHHLHEIKMQKMLKSRDDKKRALYGGNKAKLALEKSGVLVQETLVEEFNQDLVEPTYMDEFVMVFARKIIKNQYFPHVGSIVIVAHTFAMTCDQYNATAPWKTYASISYVVCNAIFGAELMIRIAAAGSLNNFFQLKINYFEAVLVPVGVTGLIFDLRFFILLPACRLYRLMRYLPTLQHLLELAAGSLKPLSNLLVFILVVSLAVAVTGRYVFGMRMDFVRSNFSSFSEAMLTVFQLFTGDSWSSVLYAAMAAMDDRGSMLFAGLFVMAWFVFSSFIINNLFVAVIIENFEVTETIENIEKDGYIANLRSSFAAGWQNFSVVTGAVNRGEVRVDVDDGGELLDPMHSFLRRSRATKNLASDSSPNMRMGVLREGLLGKMHQRAGNSPGAVREASQVKISDAKLMLQNTGDGRPVRSAMAVGGGSHKRSHILKVIKWATIKVDQEEEVQDDSYERVLYCVYPDYTIRKFFLWLGRQWLFDAAVYTAILVSCVFLMLMPPGGVSTADIQRIDPEYPVPINDRTATLCSYVFTFIFTAEFLVKVLDRGLLFTRRAYLKDSWNVLDSIILGVSWADVAIDLLGLESFKEGNVAKVLRLGRALRPLRLLKRIESMRAVIDALLGTLRPVAYVILFLILTMVVFSLIGMGLFGGMFYHCSTQDLLYYTTDPAVSFPRGKTECMGFWVRDDGVMMQRSWINYPYHFDTFYDAIKTLFVVQTYKFITLMQISMDVTALDTQLQKNHSQYNAAFFILYVFVGGLFVMNLFVGFIVDGFNANKGSSEAEIHYNRCNRLLDAYKPKYSRFSLPANEVSALCRTVMGSSYWQAVSSVCVAVNVSFNLTDHANSPAWYNDVIETQNDIFNYVLFVEVFLNLIGYGPGGFVDDRWKMFDAFVAGGSLAGMILSNPSVTKFSKAFRLARILRLMIMIKAIRVIMETLISVLPQLVNILLLLVLVYSIFAVVFIQFFGLTKYGNRLGQTAEFYHSGWSLLTIFQIVTGDEWHVMMTDCSVEWPSCTEAFDEEHVPGWTAWKGEPLSKVSDCGKPYAFPFWLILKLFCEKIMLNLFIGMILDNFSFITDEVSHVEDARWTGGPSAHQIHQLAKGFAHFDNRSGRMPISALHSLLCIIPQPLGFRRKNGDLQFGPWERASERLIRAELNVIVRFRRNELLQKQINSWNPFASITNKNQDKMHKIDFVTCMKTCLHWRKPDMVPVVLKQTRGRRVDEVILTAYGLVIVDCFIHAVQIKKAKKTNKTLNGMKEFKRFIANDQARNRRQELYLEEISKEKELAEKEKKKSLALYWNATDMTRMVLEQISDLPEDMLSHHAAVRANKLKVPKPINGLETFRNLSETHIVALKFLDPKHAKTGYVLADFTQLNFNGWMLKNTSLDTFLMPTTRRSKPAQVAEAWTKIDVVMFKGKSVLARSREKQLGSLVDIQSFVHAEGSTREDLLSTATSKVRMNLGVLRMDNLLRDIAGHNVYEAGPNEIFQVEESILEVVGYTPLTPGANDIHSISLRPNAEAEGANPSAEDSEAPGRRSNNLQDVDTVEETWGQHQETQSEVEAREAEELRLAEEEHAAQELISSQPKAGMAASGEDVGKDRTNPEESVKNLDS